MQNRKETQNTDVLLSQALSAVRVARDKLATLTFHGEDLPTITTPTISPQKQIQNQQQQKIKQQQTDANNKQQAHTPPAQTTTKPNGDENTGKTAHNKDDKPPTTTTTKSPPHKTHTQKKAFKTLCMQTQQQQRHAQAVLRILASQTPSSQTTAKRAFCRHACVVVVNVTVSEQHQPPNSAKLYTATQLSLVHQLFVRVFSAVEGVVAVASQGQGVQSANHVIVAFENAQFACQAVFLVCDTIDKFVEFQLDTRFGVHYGEVVVLPSAVMGPAVHLAERLAMEVAESGEVLVTASTMDSFDENAVSNFESEERTVEFHNETVSYRTISGTVPDLSNRLSAFKASTLPQLLTECGLQIADEFVDVDGLGVLDTALACALADDQRAQELENHFESLCHFGALLIANVCADNKLVPIFPALQHTLALHALLTPLAFSHNGRLVGNTGERLFLFFPNAKAAFLAAKAMHSEVQNYVSESFDKLHIGSNGSDGNPLWVQFGLTVSHFAFNNSMQEPQGVLGVSVSVCDALAVVVASKNDLVISVQEPTTVVSRLDLDADRSTAAATVSSELEGPVAESTATEIDGAAVESKTSALLEKCVAEMLEDCIGGHCSHRTGVFEGRDFAVIGL